MNIVYRVVAAAASALVAAAALGAEAGRAASLLDLSLEELANLQVTSVSKAEEPLATAAAAVFVITHEAIAQSGATRLVEALRLAPNLRVVQYSATSWGVSARGLGGASQDQNFANKLLVLIDGRSVYTPLFSGVYWQAQDVPLDDVDRIEVISGPGATLWGANAYNGVINVITRGADTTLGARLEAAAGNQLRRVELGYGGALGAAATYRVYLQGFEQDGLRTAEGRDAGDDWSKAQAGFRLDWARDADALTLQGDVYRGVTSVPSSPAGSLGGANSVVRWTRRTSARSTVQAQAYFDQTQQFAPAGGLAFVLHTWDAQAQHTLEFDGGHQLVWGAGHRLNRYDIRNAFSLFYQPNARQLALTNAFASATLALPAHLRLTLGLKLEDNAYTGWEALPDVRVAWSPDARTVVWAAASRAVRSPTPFDRDVRERFGTTVFLIGGPEFRPETLNAYQLGVRARPHESLTLSANAFYNEYDRLRSIDAAPGPTPIPFRWANGIRGHAYGAEVWAAWQIGANWQLWPGYQWLHKDLSYRPNAGTFVGVRQSGNDPEHVAMLTTRWSPAPRWDVSATLRYVGALPDPRVGAYTELDAYLGWRVSERLTFALRGQNLRHARHREYVVGQAEDIPRSGVLEVRWRY